MINYHPIHYVSHSADMFLVQCEDLLLFSAIHDCKVKISEFCTVGWYLKKSSPALENYHGHFLWVIFDIL